MSLRPRLGPKESRLWDDWLEIYGGDYRNYIYDIRVEPRALEFTKEGEPILRQWQKVGAPRIDVCACSHAGQPVIVEVKPVANFDTVAQVIAYKELMATLGRVPGKVEMVIICRTISTINEQLCTKYGIKIYKLKDKAEPDSRTLPGMETKGKD